MNPIIIDNAVPSLLFERFSYQILSFETEWHYMNSTAYRRGVGSDNSFSHTALFDGQKTSDLLYLYESVLLCGLSKADIDIQSIIRMRCGLFSKASTENIHPPHVDYDFPHMTALLYIDETDGDTILYNEKHDPEVMNNAQDYYEIKLQKNVTVQQKVSPVPNRMVIFDGLQYHSSSSPVLNNRRVVANFNFTKR